MPTCGDAGAVARALTCRNSTSAAHIKLLSTLVIFATSVAGISFPVVLAKSFAGKPAYDRATLVIKCYAAGVILSTSLVHVLPDAFDALADCAVATRHPWKDFPFAGLVTLIGALLALLVDLAANSSHAELHGHGEYTQLNAPSPHCHGGTGDGKVEMVVVVRENGDVVEERESEKTSSADVAEVEEIREKMRQRMVSQVLEIGIIFHSVIIGVTMGMGLGGCIAQAGFSFKTTAYMCFMFSVTTPVGILLGMIIYSLTGYDDSSANALISEGLLGSLSSGILIYMALVDLISADFFHNKLMSSETMMKKGCYIALVLGSASMSILALWA